jgi:hypothetical protein
MNEGNNKTQRGGVGAYDSLNGGKNFDIGEVVSVTDTKYLGRIKVRVKGSRSVGGDDGIVDADLSWCSFNPKTYFFTTKNW